MILTLIPRISEQSLRLAASNTYVFNVEPVHSKQAIKEAVEKQFDVTVIGINTAIVKGKKKASNRKQQRPVMGKRKDLKKAYITLKEGDKIALFEELR